MSKKKKKIKINFEVIKILVSFLANKLCVDFYLEVTNCTGKVVERVA
jgi:hypothetical protein